MKTMRVCGAALIVVASMAISTSTEASEIQGGPSSRVVYTLTGVTFEDGGTLTGSFVFDPSVPCEFSPPCTAYSAVIFSTSSGSNCFVGNRNYGTHSETTNSNLISFGPPQTSLTLQVFFASDLGAPGTIAINTSSDERDGTGCQRNVVSGSVVGVLENVPPEIDPPDPPVDPPVDPPTPPVAPPGTGEVATGTPDAGAGPPPSGGTGNQLPETGSSSVWIVLVALALVGLGFTARRMGTPRRSTLD